ncbi:MAG: flagellar hook-basal body complex protein FliE [Treponema sp.]|nr:flagellar hook-basal body complex protein FliE [Candidatus Treponema scatequi]
MTINHLGQFSNIETFLTTGQTTFRNLRNQADDQIDQTKKNFGDFLAEAVSKMNDQQLDVNRLEEKALVDPDSVDIHDITTAMAKAQMSLSLAKTVVDRVVTGWNEITTTR